jgi:hypothetical protein
VRANRILKDPDTLEPIGFLPEAFQLRDGEDGLSASWVQHFQGEKRVAVAAAMEEFAGVFEVKRKDRFALGAVGAIKAACAGEGVKVRIVHDGKVYGSHAAVRQFSAATFELSALLATEAWAAMVAPSAPAIAISRTRVKSRS